MNVRAPHRVRASWTLPLVAAALAAAHQVALLAAFGRRYVSEDQALLWAAARDMGQGQLRQPNFWGQAYGVTFEAAPAELFRHIGIGYPTGLPLGVIGLNLLAWWAPGWAAWRRDRPLLATVAVAAPILLSLEHGLLLVVYNTAFGRMLAGLAAAVAILRPDRRSTVAVVVALGGFGVLFDASSALIAGPVLGLLIGHRHRWGEPRHIATSAGVGLAPVMAWVLFTGWWYDRHPDDSMHPSPALRPSWAVLTDNLRHPRRHFATFAPELWRNPLVVGGCVAGLAVVAVRRRAWWAAAAIAVFCLLTLLALSLPRSRDGLPTIYYTPARVLLSFPMGLWCCAAALPNRRPVDASQAVDSRPDRRRRAVATLLAGAIMASAGVRVATWERRLGRLRDEAVAFENYPLTATPALVGLCDRVGRVAADRGISVVLFDLRTPAYACAGVFGAEPTTLYPPYERRAWLLRMAERAGPAELLVVGPTPRSCAEAGLTCQAPGEPDMVIVGLDGSSPLSAIRGLGVEVRVFTSGL